MSDRIIMVAPREGARALRLSLREYQGRPYLELRAQDYDGQTADRRVSIRMAEVDELIRGLYKAAQLHREERPA